MKKWLILLLLASSQMSHCVFADTATIGGITWTYTVANRRVSLDSVPYSTTGAIAIPSILGGYPVASIGWAAFSGRSGLTSVIIPDSVTSIGSDAFYGCSGLTNITIPDSVTSIGMEAFYGCSRLKSVTIGNSVASIAGSAFENCSRLTSVTIPDSVTSIGNYAFENCSGLTSLTIGNSVSSIGHHAFNGCSGLMSITVGSENANYSSVNGLLLSKDGSTLIRGVNGEVIIPDSVTSIGSGAFDGCKGLTSVTIPDSVTYIGTAFSDCNDTLYDTTTIPGVRLVDGWVVGNTGHLSGSMNLMDVRGICDSAFYYCTNLTSVTIGDSVISIGHMAFCGCRGLTSVTIGSTVNSIGDYAFDGCRNVTNVVFRGVAPKPRSNLATLLNYTSKVYYRRYYSDSYEGIVPSSKFGGYLYLTLGDWVDIDNNSLITGGDAVWCGIEDVSHDFHESLQSGRIGDNECSWVEATINGSGRISFWWKSSSEEYDGEVFDYAHLSIDGVPQGRVFFDENSERNILEGIAIGGKTGWTNVVIDVVGEGAHTIRWTYCKDGMDEADVGEDCVWLDEFSFTPRPTISFDIGASTSGDAPDSIHEFTGTDITLPKDDGFSWPDHVFDGWTDGISDYATGASFTMPTSNVTFIAKWIAKSFLTFDIGGGEGSTPMLIKALPNTIVTLPTDGGFAWTDHVFDGWTDGANDYEGGADYAVPTSNVTLTAKWIAKSFVAFDIGEGTGKAPETIKDVPNAVIELPADNGFSWTDHVFIGWDLGNWTYEIGTAEWNNFTVPSSNVILKAHWLAKSFVSFDIGDGTGETPQMIKALPDEIISLPTGEGLALTDYAFGGWTDGMTTYAAEGNYIVPETNVTLTAVWIAKRFLTFTLDGGEGEIPVAIKDVPNAIVALPSGEGLSKPKYTFAGWNDGTQTYEAGAEYVVTDSSIEFSAVWAANTLVAPVIASADVANGGTIETESATIEISAEDGTTIYYTMDGTEPTTNSTLYTVPFTADGMDVTIKAFAVMVNYFDSGVAEFSFNRKPHSAAECINANDKTISTGGNDTAWVRVLGDAAHDGTAALRSGAIGDGTSSSIEVTVDGAGEIGYWWKVSSEISRNRKFDYVSFLIDGVEQSWLGGEKGWTNEVYAVSGEGTHTLKWVYQKNENGLTQGEDCAWLDEVKWTPWHEITTKQTTVPIPYGWLDSHGLLSTTDAETAAKQPTGKRDGSGRLLTVEDDFIAGTDPTDASDIFTVSIAISNGVPVVEWKPNLNTNGENRIYTIYGKETLNDEEWITPTNALCRFFKVGVAMPTKEENNDSTGGDNGGDEGGNESGGNDSGDGNNESDDADRMIPSGYSTNDVQCVSCTGSEWYDLGLPPTLTMKTQIKCSFAGENEHMAIIGVLPTSGNDVNDYRLFIASSPFEWFLDFPDSSRIRGASAALNEVREVEFGNFYIKDLETDSMLISGSTVTASCPSHNIRLFRTNYNNPSKYTTGSVYYVRIYDLNALNEYELVRNLVPCKSDSDEVGLLDLVEMRFYKDNGTNVSVVE